MTTMRSLQLEDTKTFYYPHEFQVKGNMRRKLDQLDIILKIDGRAFVDALRDYSNLLLNARHEQFEARLTKAQENNTIALQQYYAVDRLIDKLILADKQKDEISRRVDAINTFSAEVASMTQPIAITNSKVNSFLNAAKKVLYQAAHFIGGTILGFVPSFILGFKSTSGLPSPFAPAICGLILAFIGGVTTGTSALLWARKKLHQPEPPPYALHCHHFYAKKDPYTKQAEKVIEIAKETPIIYKK